MPLKKRKKEKKKDTARNNKNKPCRGLKSRPAAGANAASRCFGRESKLTMLLRESLGNLNCRTTMIAHISAAAASYAETLSTIQIASRVLRMKKKKTKVRGAEQVREGRSWGGPALEPHCEGPNPDF